MAINYKELHIYSAERRNDLSYIVTQYNLGKTTSLRSGNLSYSRDILV